MKDLQSKSDNEFNTVLFEENGFSIRVGHFDYCFIAHDACDTIDDSRSVAYDVGYGGKILFRKHCRKCNVEYSNEMDGLITLLNWKI